MSFGPVPQFHLGNLGKQNLCLNVNIGINIRFFYVLRPQKETCFRMVLSHRRQKTMLGMWPKMITGFAYGYESRCVYVSMFIVIFQRAKDDDGNNKTSMYERVILFVFKVCDYPRRDGQKIFQNLNHHLSNFAKKQTQCMRLITHDCIVFHSSFSVQFLHEKKF